MMKTDQIYRTVHTVDRLQNGLLEIIELLPNSMTDFNQKDLERQFYILSDEISITVRTNQGQEVRASSHQAVIVPATLSCALCNETDQVVKLLVTKALPVFHAQSKSFAQNKSRMFKTEEQCVRVRDKAQCIPVCNAPGEVAYELTGLVIQTREISLALIELESDQSSSNHYHPSTEELYVILEGKGKVIRDGQIIDVTAHDIVSILPDQQHQIFNTDQQKPLKFLAVCFPAWTPTCGVYVTASDTVEQSSLRLRT
jgi:mannose-6-phosphate isomerase-like protein (cupin superfamily)